MGTGGQTTMPGSATARTPRSSSTSRPRTLYTEAAIAHLSGLRERLFEEIKSRIEETDLSVPVQKGPWWYLTRTTEGLAYPIHCRVPAVGPGREPGVPPMPDEADLAPGPVARRAGDARRERLGKGP